MILFAAFLLFLGWGSWVYFSKERTTGREFWIATNGIGRVLYLEKPSRVEENQRFRILDLEGSPDFFGEWIMEEDSPGRIRVNPPELPGQPPNVFQGDRLARFKQLQEKRGFQIGRRGLSASRSVEYPEFFGRGPSVSKLNALIEKEARRVLKAARDYTSISPNEIYMSWKDPNVSFGIWYYEATFNVTYYSLNRVSLFVEINTYMGGAHPNQHTHVYNLQWIDSEWRPMDLSQFKKEMLLGGEELIDVLVAKLEELRERPLGEDFKGETDNLKFYGSPNGLHFHFDPYEIGSYAEGSYDVIIPAKPPH